MLAISEGEMVKAKMTRAQYDRLAAQLKQQQGVSLSGDKGTVQAKGVTATYAFDGAELQIAVTHHPFPTTVHFCESSMADWLRTAGATADVVG